MKIAPPVLRDRRGFVFQPDGRHAVVNNKMTFRAVTSTPHSGARNDGARGSPRKSGATRSEAQGAEPQTATAPRPSRRQSRSGWKRGAFESRTGTVPRLKRFIRDLSGNSCQKGPFRDQTSPHGKKKRTCKFLCKSLIIK